MGQEFGGDLRSRPAFPLATAASPSFIDLVGEPDVEILHVRFDERRLGTEPREGVRQRHRGKPPETVTWYGRLDAARGCIHDSNPRPW